VGLFLRGLTEGGTVTAKEDLRPEIEERRKTG
jgi:hypothetical protein